MEIKNCKLIVGIIIGAFMCSYISSCSDDEEDAINSTWLTSGPSKNFITGYCLVDSISVDPVNIAPEHNSVCTSVRFYGESISQSDDSERFSALANFYSDTSYNRRVAISGNMAVAWRIDSISVNSDMDYDSRHMAGTELNDVFQISLVTYGNFILGNYKDKESDYSHIEEVEKPYSKITPEDFTLLKKFPVRFYFTTLPTLSQVHNMTFTFYFEGGTVLSATQQMDFGKVK